MTGSDGQRGERSTADVAGGVAPGSLSALLEELARLPSADLGAAWDSWLKPGAVIGRFELIREIGRGGLGVVYEARDRELGRSVAFKAVRAGGTAALREERLLREAETAARLSHPNIATLHDVGRTEHGPYLVLELLRGQTLEARLGQGSVPVREALRIGVEVARGLAHAHSQGVVHRDLKPSNVFLCEDGQVKVLDFGLAHAFGQRRADGGTPSSMAPEQWKGAPEDERTDVFAMGVMLYQMLAGELPFPEDDGGKAVQSARKAPALEVPEEPALGELVGKMLEKDPTRRPRDGGMVLSALSAFEKELERSSGRASAPVRARRRSPWRLVAPVAAGVLLGTLAAVIALRRSAPPSPPPSIAVLPFADMSPGRDQDYFSDGIAEEILNALAHVPELRVVGRTSSFSFKGKSEDLRTIGRKLDAATVLEGSVRREGGRVRVTAQLVKAADGYHIWSETYDREAGGIFQVQGEIARAVVAAMVPKLVGTPSGAAAAAPATSPEAYNQYLIGKQFLSRITAESHRRAAQAFEKALAVDDSYAPAWAALAEALYLRSILDEVDPAPLVEQAHAAASRAIALGPHIAAGYSARCVIRSSLWDWSGARADAERAVALEPGSATARRRFAVLVWEVTGDPTPAVELLRHATVLDPLSPIAWQLLGQAYRSTGRWDLARDALRRALEIDPDQQWALSNLAHLELMIGNLDEAQRLAARAELPSDRLYWEAVFAHARGKKQAARDAVAVFAARYGATMPEAVASLYASQGDADLAFEWLERALSSRDPALRWVKRAYGLQGLHGDPRWKVLLKRMNLPVD